MTGRSTTSSYLNRCFRCSMNDSTGYCPVKTCSNQTGAENLFKVPTDLITRNQSEESSYSSDSSLYYPRARGRAPSRYLPSESSSYSSLFSSFSSVTEEINDLQQLAENQTVIRMQVRIDTAIRNILRELVPQLSAKIAAQQKEKYDRKLKRKMKKFEDNYECKECEKANVEMDSVIDEIESINKQFTKLNKSRRLLNMPTKNDRDELTTLLDKPISKPETLRPQGPYKARCVLLNHPSLENIWKVNFEKPAQISKEGEKISNEVISVQKVTDAPNPIKLTDRPKGWTPFKFGAKCSESAPVIQNTVRRVIEQKASQSVPQLSKGIDISKMGNKVPAPAKISVPCTKLPVPPTVSGVTSKITLPSTELYLPTIKTSTPSTKLTVPTTKVAMLPTMLSAQGTKLPESTTKPPVSQIKFSSPLTQFSEAANKKKQEQVPNTSTTFNSTERTRPNYRLMFRRQPSSGWGTSSCL